MQSWAGDAVKAALAAHLRELVRSCELLAPHLENERVTVPRPARRLLWEQENKPKLGCFHCWATFFSHLNSFYCHHIAIVPVGFPHVHFWGRLKRTDSLNMAKREKQLTGACFALFLF